MNIKCVLRREDEQELKGHGKGIYSAGRGCFGVFMMPKNGLMVAHACLDRLGF